MAYNATKLNLLVLEKIPTLYRIVEKQLAMVDIEKHRATHGCGWMWQKYDLDRQIELAVPMVEYQSIQKAETLLKQRRDVDNGSTKAEKLRSILLKYPKEDALKQLAELRAKFADWIGNAPAHHPHLEYSSKESHSICYKSKMEWTILWFEKILEAINESDSCVKEYDAKVSAAKAAQKYDKFKLCFQYKQRSLIIHRKNKRRALNREWLISLSEKSGLMCVRLGALVTYEKVSL